MSREIIINAQEDVQVAIFENKKMVEFLVESPDERAMVGDIYKGVIKNILPGIEAAFVDIGLKKNAFLYLSDISLNEESSGEVETSLDEESDLGGKPSVRLADTLQVGEEILVQVVKEAIGNKGPTLTSNITLAGRYLVLTPTSKHIGISRRIGEEEERERLEKTIRELVPPRMGLIARTNAEGKGTQILEAELERLLMNWRRIKRHARQAAPSSLVHKELPLTLRVVRDIFAEGGDRILIDSRTHYEEITRFLEESGLKDSKSCVNLYEGDGPIFEALNIKKEIANTLARKIWLKCGGYIIIDELEALVAIDVNSGRYTGSRSQEKTILKVNLEAAKEVARQLRLRNLGGIIIVDFIDMKDEGNRKRLIDTLERELGSDRVKCNVYPLTQLGLVEITRKRSSESLDGVLREECPLCLGEGRVLSTRFLESSLIGKIHDRLRGLTPPAGLHLRLNPMVCERLKESERLRGLAEGLGARIKFWPDEEFEWDQMEVITD